MAIFSKDFTNIVTQKKVSVDVDLSRDLEGLTDSQQTKLKRIVGETLIDEVLKSTASKTSSVNNAKFQKLSKEYRKKKMSEGKIGQPNLRLSSEMLDSLFRKNSPDGVSLKITNPKSKKKAENHNNGVTVPQRQFLPTKSGKGFKQDIMKVVNAKIRDYKKSIK